LTKLFIGNFLALHFSRVIRTACICQPNVADISKHQTWNRLLKLIRDLHSNLLIFSHS
jgi:hypothetical protein